MIVDEFFHINFFLDDSWKQDVERETRVHDDKSRFDLSVYLFNYLTNKYPDVVWAVVIYDDVYGWDTHTIKGDFYSIFRHHGNNVVVGRIVSPYRHSYPNDIGGKFQRALSQHMIDTCTGWCWGEKLRVNAQPTVDTTWNNLYTEGLTPIMLLVYRGGIDGSVTVPDNSPWVQSRQLNDGGIATLLAVG